MLGSNQTYHTEYRVSARAHKGVEPKTHTSTLGYKTSDSLLIIIEDRFMGTATVVILLVLAIE